jgi:putative spermidine/putrescine transport system ATP-binding protein
MNDRPGETSAEHFLRLEGIGKRFGSNTVVREVDIAVMPGEFVSFLGPSGCGKTTILRMVAGFETPSTGRIIVDGKDITRLPPNRRNVGMVFQAYALFPNMNVAGNIGFGLKIAGASSADVARRVDEMLDLIGLAGYEKRYPFELSGGQQQRVALARALAARPAMLLLDEPLSALDAKIRLSLREQIRSIQHQLGITTIFVTHDQEEALSMSDRIVVMNAGRVEQIGTPFEVYNRPATRFVASFVGTLSVLNGTVAEPATGAVRVAGTTIENLALPKGIAKGAPLPLAVRPEAVRFGKANGGDVSISGEISDVDFLGSVIRIRLKVEGEVLSLDTFNDPSAAPPRRGDRLDVTFARESVLVLDGQ